MRSKNRKRRGVNKRGFTLTELVVVMAIMTICSGMLVGVIASTIDRYSASTQIETRKQEAIHFEEYYTKYARAAFTIAQDPTYGTGSFTLQENTYYLLFDRANMRMTFFTKDDSGNRMDVISCSNIKYYSHRTDYVDDQNKKNTLTYEIVMENQFNDKYTNTIVLNNGAGITLPYEEYNAETSTDEVCFAFRMVP